MPPAHAVLTWAAGGQKENGWDCGRSLDPGVVGRSRTSVPSTGAYTFEKIRTVACALHIRN
jgi:hypothetical protein